jgi:hypothetical protein
MPIGKVFLPLSFWACRSAPPLSLSKRSTTCKFQIRRLRVTRHTEVMAIIACQYCDIVCAVFGLGGTIGSDDNNPRVPLNKTKHPRRHGRTCTESPSLTQPSFGLRRLSWMARVLLGWTKGFVYTSDREPLSTHNKRTRSPPSRRPPNLPPPNPPRIPPPSE